MGKSGFDLFPLSALPTRTYSFHLCPLRIRTINVQKKRNQTESHCPDRPLPSMSSDTKFSVGYSCAPPSTTSSLATCTADPTSQSHTHGEWIYHCAATKHAQDPGHCGVSCCSDSDSFILGTETSDITKVHEFIAQHASFPYVSVSAKRTMDETLPGAMRGFMHCYANVFHRCVTCRVAGPVVLPPTGCK
jgi:hypothetical protein